MMEISKAVIQKNDKVLLLKRSANSKSFPNLWDFPGGRHNQGESPEQAVIRETEEETSYRISPGPEVRTENYHDEKHDLLFHYFRPSIISGSLSLSSDHSDFMWASQEEINRLELQPSVKLFFQ